MRFQASELAAHLGGELVGSDVIVEGASIDSRTIRPWQLFAPIVAERDGHVFIPAAREAGASAYLTAQEPVGGTAIRVLDTAAALLSLGALARDQIGGAIGVTGAVGKTTTKRSGQPSRRFYGFERFQNAPARPGRSCCGG